jgi:hypothetical protein
MRIWDIDPGYLNRQSLLGEHRELHGMFVVLSENRKGYAAHPETRRWRGHLAALGKRHDLLVEEMQLRGYNHHSPLPVITGETTWPKTFIDPPHAQFAILQQKYRAKEPGRTPCPPRPGSCGPSINTPSWPVTRSFTGASAPGWPPLMTSSASDPWPGFWYAPCVLLPRQGGCGTVLTICGDTLPILPGKARRAKAHTTSCR